MTFILQSKLRVVKKAAGGEETEHNRFSVISPINHGEGAIEWLKCFSSWQLRNRS